MINKENIFAGITAILSIFLSIAFCWASFGGIYHAFKGHGTADGFIAVFIPPYSWYRSMEFFFHKQDVVGYMNIGNKDVPIYREKISGLEQEVIDMEPMLKTRDGRDILIKEMTIPNDVWQKLLNYIQSKDGHKYQSTMQEDGNIYDLTVSSLVNGITSMQVSSVGEKDYEVFLIDQDSDQTPDILKFLKMNPEADGKNEEGEISLLDLDEEKSSQLLIVWGLAWATVLNENKDYITE